MTTGGWVKIGSFEIICGQSFALMMRMKLTVFLFCPPTSRHGRGGAAPGAVRASSIFPILSVILLFMGGLCIAASEFYKSRHNIILSAGIFFVSAG